MMGHNYILFIFYVLLNVFNIKSLDPSYSHNRENKGFYDVNIDKDDNKENHSTNKRPNILPPNHSSLSQMCPNSIIRKGHIIKTNDSIQAGAKFLDIPRTGSVKECHEKCCNLLHCNTAVVKVLSSSRVLCYLFDCGVVSRCSFDDHKDYKVIELKYEEQTHNDDLTTAPSVNENVLQNSSHMEEKSKVKCPVGYHRVGNECKQIVIKTTAQSTQSSLMKTTAVHSTKGMVNSPVIENVTTAVINSLKSTTPLSSKLSLKSFSGKYIELSKFSLHKIEDSRGGAVLVLSVGVGLIIVSFAVFVCQMQKFRKQGRNRKAKNMHGDSDYLINGLYL